MKGIEAGNAAQQTRNAELLGASRYLGDSVTSQVLPLQIDIGATAELGNEQVLALEALEVEAARVAIDALAELAKLKEVDHLGGGLELIPSLLLSLALTDYDKVEYTIEHAHTSIGYYSALAALGFIKPEDVVSGFRSSLDVPGHVSWVPGGTQLNGGRLGVMIPAAVGQALGKRARHGEEGWVVAHCGDAGWISGQALNGFNGADVHGAPITFVMHRNGIQLSGSTRSILDKDPRSIIASLGVEIVEIPSLHDTAALYGAYRQANALARSGRPSMIYPVGYGSSAGTDKADLNTLGQLYGIGAEVEAFAGQNGVALDTSVWIPGSLMSYRDVEAMLECVFLVNELPGGKGHHDGHLQGRDAEALLAGPMFRVSAEAEAALQALRQAPARRVETAARPAPGSANLNLPVAARLEAKLPAAGAASSPRAGSEAAYAALAGAFGDDLFVVSCDLDPSTKLGKATAQLAADHCFEMSIEEQAAALVVNGLALSGSGPQFNVVSTFAAFYEGIAREGFDMWRYQRNLNGVNEGLNVAYHLSHVGAVTGRDHFSGWGLDWINIGLTYLPYLDRFYTPADARAAFVAVLDMASRYGGHVIGIPREGDLPTLTAPQGDGPLWAADAEWEALTTYRSNEGARRAVLAVGATAALAGDAAEALQAEGMAVDVVTVNGFPLAADALSGLMGRYPEGIVTVEDGLIGTPASGIKGFAALVANAAYGSGLPLGHVGITDPRVAPSEGWRETWAHFGITAEAVAAAVKNL
jgi:transketolase